LITSATTTQIASKTTVLINIGFLFKLTPQVDY
jgi:hypothetical protein